MFDDLHLSSFTYWLLFKLSPIFLPFVILVDLKYIFIEIVILIVLSFKVNMSVSRGWMNLNKQIQVLAKEVGVGLLKWGMNLKYYFYMKMAIENSSVENVLIF